VGKLGLDLAWRAVRIIHYRSFACDTIAVAAELEVRSSGRFSDFGVVSHQLVLLPMQEQFPFFHAYWIWTVTKSGSWVIVGQIKLVRAGLVMCGVRRRNTSA